MNNSNLHLNLALPREIIRNKIIQVMASHVPEWFSNWDIVSGVRYLNETTKANTNNEYRKIHHIISYVFVDPSSLLGKVMELLCEKAEKINYCGWKKNSFHLSIFLQINCNQLHCEPYWLTDTLLLYSGPAKPNRLQDFYAIFQV